jgi:hypothetical protein
VLFLEDPAAAMRAAAASSELDMAAMIKLEAVLSGLAHKLDLPVGFSSEIPLEKAS